MDNDRKYKIIIGTILFIFIIFMGIWLAYGLTAISMYNKHDNTKAIINILGEV